MFKGFKFQVVLPVVAIALLLISCGAVGFSLWAQQHEEALVKRQITEQVAAIQGIFVTAAQLMDERTRSSMLLLKEQISLRGGVERGPRVTVANNNANDLIVAGKGQGNNFEIVDYITHYNKGTATLFSKDGPRFVRISTNVKKDDGSRAIGTELDNSTRAYAALISGQPFYGVVDILGNAYFTGYEPLYANNGDFVGLTYVGYKAELPVLQRALDQSRLLKSGFVAVSDSTKPRYWPSWTTKEQVQQHLGAANDSWVITRSPLPEWGLTIVSAYPRAELRSIGRRIGYGVALGGLVVGAGISLALFILLDWKVLELLGGEPRVAAEHMRRIANGDLVVDINVDGGRSDSLMASLKVMQLKLRNLVSSVRGGAAEVTEKSRKFETAANVFQRERDDATLQELLRQGKAVSQTLAVLDKSVGRFRL